jgi:hypothetical protein
MTTPPLSPAAQAAWDAYKAEDPYNFPRAAIAAALRATTEQPYSVPAYFRGDEYSNYVEGVEAERERNRSIANELDPQP